MRKSIIIFTISAVMLLSLPVTALAHGHGNSSAGQSHALCSIEGCSTAGDHWHDGTAYAGHYYGDGHSHQTAGHRGRGHH